MGKLSRIDAAFQRAYRLSALREQHGFCLYCFAPLTRSSSTAEHRDPRSKGGSNQRQNIAASCADCNNAKASMSEKAWIAAITREKSGVPVPVLLARFRRRMWLATHRTCRTIQHTTGGRYQMPKGVG